MKVILFTIGLLISTTVSSQTVTDTSVIQGQLTGNYFIFEIPKNPEGKGLQLLTPGDLVYIVRVVTTNRNPPQDVWYHCFYKNIEGYIPTTKVEINDDWTYRKSKYLFDNKDLPPEARLEIIRKVSTREAFISDSIDRSNQMKLESINRQIDSGKRDIIKGLVTLAKRDKILIVRYSYPLNTLDYPGFIVRFINGADKPIKYATFKIIAFNPVNDPVGTKEVKCIGPIAPLDNKEYHFDYVFFSKVTDHYSIPTVKIQYMDNSIITIPGENLLKRFSKTEMDKLAQFEGFEEMLKEVYYSHLK